jgi:hypothetical protein
MALIGVSMGGEPCSTVIDLHVGIAFAFVQVQAHQAVLRGLAAREEAMEEEELYRTILTQRCVPPPRPSTWHPHTRCRYVLL